MSSMRQQRLMPAFRTLSGIIMHSKGTTRTCKGSTVADVKRETALRTLHNMLRLLTQFRSFAEVKDNLERLKVFPAEPKTSITLTPICKSVIDN